MHTGDLHLGKQIGEVSLIEDQGYILDQMTEVAKREKADGVLIAGDVYQRSAPQAEAMELFDRFVTELAGMGMKVFVISGNHDSELRISYFARLVKRAGVYVSEKFEGSMGRVTLKDEYGEVDVWMLPFIRPSRVKPYLPEERIVTYQDAARAVIRNCDVDSRRRNVLLAHQFITGCETSESEERAVGGLDNIDAAVFEDFDYVALGHIHKPQRVSRDTLRYSGSPLKYSFSEAGHKKSVAIVDVEEKGSVRVRTVPLMPIRDMRTAEGTMRELVDMPYTDDYMWVTVKDDTVPPDAKWALRANFPNMLRFSVDNARQRYDRDVSGGESVENKSFMELFTEFYREMNNGVDPAQDRMKVMEKVRKELEEAEYETR